MTRITPKTINPDIDQGTISFYDQIGTRLGTVADLLPSNTVHIAPSGGDDTATVQKLLDSGVPICFSTGVFNVNNLVISRGGQQLFSLAGPAGFVPGRLLKNANGPMFTVSSGALRAWFHNIALDGNGGTYTGVGIDVRASVFRYLGGRITNTASYCIDFTAADATQAGTISNVELDRTDSSPGNPMIRLAPDSGAISTDKLIEGCTVTGDLLDTNSANVAVVVGNSFQNMIFQTGSKKMIVVGNRMATLGADTTVQGVNHMICGNAHAGHFIIPASNCTSCLVGPNLCVTQSVDNSPAGSNNLLIDTYSQNLVTLPAGNTIRSFTASPEGVLSGPPGSLVLNSNGGAGTSLYVKQTATAAATGWAGK